MKEIRQISKREIAINLVLELAESGAPYCFSPMGFYDNDSDFLSNLADRLEVKWDNKFINKLKVVARTLVNYGVLSSKMSGTAKEYVDEPSKQMNYFLRADKVGLLTREKSYYTYGPRGEAEYLLRYAFPEER